jgi:hypothetical protein
MLHNVFFWFYLQHISEMDIFMQVAIELKKILRNEEL